MLWWWRLGRAGCFEDSLVTNEVHQIRQCHKHPVIDELLCIGHCHWQNAHARGFALHQPRETAVDVQVRAANEESGDRRAFGRQACAEVDVCQG